MENTLATAPEVLFYMLKDHVLISDEDRYFTRDEAIAEVKRRNAVEPGHTCVGIPSRLTACDGCQSHLLDVIYQSGATHLTHIAWMLCPIHESDSYGSYSAEY
ncbi:hypothetical protein ACWDBF_17025 [Streptomyces angustmyceticus]